MKTYSQHELSQSDICLCFDDILLLPQFSDLESRNEPNLSTRIGHITLQTPILSAPMDSVTRADMLVAMSNAGGLGVLTRFIGHDNETDLQIQELELAKKNGAKFMACAIGIKNPSIENSAAAILETGCDIICLDVAHGDHVKMYSAIEKVSQLKKHYKFSIMAGNVCTKDAATRFANAGVDCAKVGIGPGASCSTRRVTGSGAPQLSAILECAEACKGTSCSIIADGGLRNTGDMVKALWAGASTVMSGFMLAGSSATPDFGHEKMYRGMSSRTVHRRSDVAAEGIEMKMHYRGKTESILLEYALGLKSGYAMQGARNVEQLRKATCVRTSPLSMKESDPVA